MKKKRKNQFISQILSVLLVAMLLFTGCNSSTDTSATTPSTNLQTESQSEESSATESVEEAVGDGTVVFYVTRHGKTMFNTVHRAQGWADTPLTEAGIEVAENLGLGLKAEGIDFVAVYSSNAGRARETAQIILASKGQENLNIVEYKNLREHGFGLFEGDLDENMWGAAAKVLGYEDMNAMMADFDTIGYEAAVAAIETAEGTGDVENVQEVKERTQAVLKEIAEKTAKDGGGNVLIVSHGMAISSMISDMTEEPITGQLPNASVTKITYKDGEFTVEAIGDTSYIELGESLAVK